jgi:predicted MFS family arabinose efflux permease
MNKRNVYIMYLIALLQGMVFYGPVATLYRQAQGVTVFQITIIESISLALCLLLELPWGVIADKIGYKKTMVFCCMLYFISKIVFWKADGFGLFLLERIMLSVIIAGMSGVDQSILYLSCDKDHSQRVFGLYNSLGTAGLLTASLVFSVFVKDNYSLSGFLTVISYGIAAVLALWLVEVRGDEKRDQSVRQFTSLLVGVAKNKRLLMLLLGVALLNEAHQTITVFLNQLQYTKCGMSPSTIGYIYIIVTIVGLCGAWSERITYKMGRGAMSYTLYSACIAACLILAFTGSAILSVLCIIILRAAFSLFQPLQMDLQNKGIETENRATALSINAIIIDSVGVGTNLVFGALADATLSGAFLFGGAACLIGMLMFAAGYKAVNIR